MEAFKGAKWPFRDDPFSVEDLVERFEGVEVLESSASFRRLLERAPLFDFVSLLVWPSDSMSLKGLAAERVVGGE